MILRSMGTLAFLLAFASSFSGASAQEAGAEGAAAGAARASGPAPYETFAKGADVRDGLIPIVRKEGKVYFALSPDQLDKDFIATSVPATGFGGLGPAPGEPYVAPARILRFERVDDTIVIRWPNSYAMTQPNSPYAQGVKESIPNSVIAVVPIVAQDKTHVVFSAHAFLGDVANLGAQFEQLSGNPMHAYRLDSERSFFIATKAFPKNDVLRVDQTWESQSPPMMVDNVPDPRNIEVQMTYNFIEAPSDGYMPRIDDPRVGFFSQGLVNFSTDDLIQRDIHYIARWNFGPRTSPAPFTATNPIVFTLSADIPQEYHQAVKDALLTWNDAFAKVGILDAVRVEEQPNDPSFDADDIRHNMIRWIDTTYPAYGAEALLVTDPRTGEELNMGVNFDATMGPDGRLIYKYEIAPARGLPDSIAAERAYDYDFIRSIMLHESGHDMGLQHNFIGSMAYTAKELQDRSFTGKYGIANSVMEYNPTNLWPKGTPQGDYDQLVLGPYDYYAIQYGYGYIPNATTPAQELPTLQRLASRWSDPKYRFASDEDADSFQTGHGIDPRVVTFDLTDKPLQWCDVQMNMNRNLMNAVNRRFPERGMPYDEARAAFMMPMRQYVQCATMAAHTIGGEYLSRAHKGDPGAGAPLTPVGLGYEREAWKVLATGLFADSAWNFNPQVLQTLTYSERSSLSGDAGWSYLPSPRHDVPVSTYVLSAQMRTLAELYAPLRLQRLDDMSAKYGRASTMSLDDLYSWSYDTIMSDIGKGGLVRRNLQLGYTKMLADMWTKPKAGTPADAQALARYSLQRIRDAAAAASNQKGLDALHRAHAQAIEAIARQALNAQATVGAPPAAPSEE